MCRASFAVEETWKCDFNVFYNFELTDNKKYRIIVNTNCSKEIRFKINIQTNLDIYFQSFCFILLIFFRVCVFYDIPISFYYIWKYQKSNLEIWSEIIKHKSIWFAIIAHICNWNLYIVYFIKPYRDPVHLWTGFR